MIVFRPRVAMGERWWSLPPQQFKVAMYLLARSEMVAGQLTAEMPGAEIAREVGITKWALIRAFEALATAGFCSVTTVLGRFGSYRATITTAATLDVQDNNTNCIGNTCAATHGAATLENTSPATLSATLTESSSTLQAIDLPEQSSAVQGDLSDRSATLSATDPQHSTEISGQNASNPRARDQDLRRSQILSSLKISDLRSSDLEYKQNKEVPTFPDPPAQPNLNLETPSPEATPTDPEQGSESRDKARRSRIDPAKIPERAWAAADYLRHHILLETPGALIGGKPWVAGWTWEGTSSKAQKRADGSQSGLRLSWANSFRLLHRDVQAGFRRSNAHDDADHVWTVISKTVHWLFHAQQGNARFRVESPESLRTKWDNIQKVKAQVQSGRSNGNGYSNGHHREFRITSSDLSDTKIAGGNWPDLPVTTPETTNGVRKP